MAKSKSDSGDWITWLIVAGLAYLCLKPPQAAATETDDSASQAMTYAPSFAQRDDKNELAFDEAAFDKSIRPIHPMPPIRVDKDVQAAPVREPIDNPQLDAYSSGGIWRDPNAFSGKSITLPYGVQPPTPPPHYQWYTQPTGTQPEYVTWYLELIGTYHPPIDPREILGASGEGQMEDTEPWPYPNNPPVM